MSYAKDKSARPSNPGDGSGIWWGDSNQMKSLSRQFVDLVVRTNFLVASFYETRPTTFVGLSKKRMVNMLPTTYRFEHPR